MTDAYPAKSKYKNAAKADHYANDRFRGGVEGREERMVKQLLGLCGDFETTLDSPCGTGRITQLLLDTKVTALDISDDMLSHVRELGEGITTQQGDIENLPFPDANFDVVLSIRFLHHLPNEELLKSCLTQLARVSKRYVIVTYFDTFAYQHLRRVLKNRRSDRPRHRHSRPWATFRKIAAEAGLRPVKRLCSAPLISEQWFVLFEKV